MRLLVVEDDPKVASFIRKGLVSEGYAVDVVTDGQTGLTQAQTVEYDLLILDLMLPRLPGLELLRRIRSQKPHLPVVVLTARGTVEDRVTGLDLGADDYLVKPFAFPELSARVRARLRHGQATPTELHVSDLAMDLIHRRVSRSGRLIELTAKEFSVLEYLMRNAERPVTRAMLVEHVWDVHFDTGTNVVDVYINILRNKIDKEFAPALIHTIRGVGYVLSEKRP